MPSYRIASICLAASALSVSAFSPTTLSIRSIAQFTSPSSISTSRLIQSKTSTSRNVAVSPSADMLTGSTRRDELYSRKEEDLILERELKIKNGPKVDMTGVVLSGMKGKALNWEDSDFPRAKEIKAFLPKAKYQPETKRSLGYLSVSTIGTAICTSLGICALRFLNPSNLLTLPFWTLYSLGTGTVAMGLWVLAHECGHGAFSKNRKLQDAVGYIIHSLMLVPYYSWQRSHAVHHLYCNDVDLGETHVPELEEDGYLKGRAQLMKTFGRKAGIRMWGALQLSLHLFIGWPAYLMIGATGGKGRGMTNHFFPNPLTKPDMPNKELFPGNWKKKVLKSDVGVAAVLSFLALWVSRKGLSQVMALYVGPLLVVNAWLIVYTWLQHTDTDVPHFSNSEHHYVKGALHTIDRPYDKMDPFGFIDFLHHKIGSTHVAHHFDSSIPHYKALAATNAIKKNFPEMYLYDPTPIRQALWRVCKGCTAMSKRGDRWVWNNEGVEDLL